MFANIVVPIDGSSPSDAAVALAVKVASAPDASITIAHVIDPAKLAAVAAPSSIDPNIAIDAARQAGTEVLARAQEAAKAGNHKVTTTLIEGDPVSAVLELATNIGADLIIVGSHGRGGLSRALLGSVAEGILRKSSIPVLVTHAPRAEPTQR